MHNIIFCLILRNGFGSINSSMRRLLNSCFDSPQTEMFAKYDKYHGIE